MLTYSIGALKMLKYLNLLQTEISRLLDAIGGLRNLEELYLSQKKKSMLPHSIGALKMLKYLNLSQTEIPRFPNSIVAL